MKPSDGSKNMRDARLAPRTGVDKGYAGRNGLPLWIGCLKGVADGSALAPEPSGIYLGDDKHLLCSEDCADRYASENADWSLDEGDWRQTGGRVTDEGEAQPGDICYWCKRPLKPEEL